MRPTGWRRFLTLAALFVFAANPARAQDPKVIDLIGDTYVTSQTQLVSNIGNSSLFNAGFSLGAFDANAALGSALVLETAAFPIGSSSGGFTYFYDAKAGAPIRSSPSFGPAFAERPLTSGRGRLNFGLTYLHRSFTELEGVDIKDGSLKFYAELNSIGSTRTVDLIQSTLKLKVKNDTTTLFATYGVMDKLDVSLAIPFQRVSVDADITSQLVRYGPTSTIPNSQIRAAVASDKVTAQGIGDVAIRAKYNIVSSSWGAVAAGIDQRLPTGDELDLLGTGRPRTQIYAAVTSKMPKLYPHANVGYTFKSKQDDDERFFFGSQVSYAAGAEYILHPRMTIIGDIIGRSLADEGRLKQQESTYTLVATTSTLEEKRTVSELTFDPGVRLNSTLAVIGAKFNPASTFIVSAHVLFPITKAGIKSNPTPVVGIDYSF
jgi:hypothetical protein